MRWFPRRSNRVPSSHRPALERLETRQLLSATISSVISPILAHPAQPSQDSIDLSTHFTDPTIPGTLVQFDTSLGSFEVALTDAATPLTVQNFLNYLNKGAYNNTAIHRNALLTSSGGGGSPTSPADIVQGGGYVVKGNELKHISTAAPINNEVATETEGNVAGTIAMAKTSDPNSATSEWFFNVHDNSTALDDTSNSGGFTTFGHVVGDGMTIVDALAALPTVKLNSTFTTIPVIGISAKQAVKKHVVVRATNLAYVKKISVIGDMTWTAHSDNPFLVQPRVAGKNLSFTYASGATGVADITVTAISADGASTVSQTFAVTVPDTTKPSQGPTAVNDSPANVSTGTSTTLRPLANDTDSTAALSPSTLTIATQPAHGTATVNTTTGYVTYTPAAGYTGPDSFTYTIKDAGGHTSSVATVSFDVTATPATTTIGTAHARQLKITEPDGTVARVNVGGGTAVITFAGSDVQITMHQGNVSATGTDATISSIVITNAAHRKASLNVSARGGTDGLVTIGSITNAGSMSVINAPRATLNGNLNVKGLRRLTLASANHSVLTIGDGVRQTSLIVKNATDTNVIADSILASVRSKQWAKTAGTNLSITAAGIGTVVTAGDFADDLNVTGRVNRIQTGGDFDGDVSASTLGTLRVGGDLAGNVHTTAVFAKKAIQIGSIQVRGSITSSTITANGNIGAISAAALSGSNIYAGVDAAVSANDALPTVAADFTSDARIGVVHLKNGNLTFSDSRIAASELRALHLGKIEPDNNGASQGVAGHVITNLTGKLTTGDKLVLGKAQLKDAATLSAFLTKKGISLGDFAIDIL